MIRKIALSTIATLGLGFAMSTAAIAAGDEGHVEDVDFSFEGPFGTFDQLQLQRGLQVYTEVCSACHGLKFVPLRTLADEGGPMLPEDQVRAYAVELEAVVDPDTGEERERSSATDTFPKSGLETAPDLSLMTKARAGFHGPAGTGLNQLFNGSGGPEYVYSILTGYTGEEKEEAGTIFYENTAFPGGWIAMAPPLSDGIVDFRDGHSNSVESTAKDVTAFLTWTAEPGLVARKEAGFKAVFFLAFLSVLLYLTNKKIWSGVKAKKD